MPQRKGPRVTRRPLCEALVLAPGKLASRPLASVYFAAAGLARTLLNGCTELVNLLRGFRELIERRPMLRTSPRLRLLTALARDSVGSAKSAGLRYVTDRSPGLARKRAGRTFRYVDAKGRPIREPDLARIRALAIPPAWTDVWVCPHALGHIQATGRDARGRKQYRYHADWRELRDEVKYGRMLSFGSRLPLIRAKVAHDIQAPGMPRTKVLGAIIQLLERTLIRIGNEEYARNNASYGLTTLRARHVTVEGNRLHFHFRGKSGKEHAVDLANPRLAAIVKRCQELPGQELFHFRDAIGNLHPVESTDVNAYLRAAAGADFTAKDFRTWHGTLLAAVTLSELAGRGRRSKAMVTKAVERVAARLGNTSSVCRKNYIHPVVISRYLRGESLEIPKAAGTDAETALLALLKEEATRAEAPRRSAA
jgi:DNA topoisomerase I